MVPSTSDKSTPQRGPPTPKQNEEFTIGHRVIQGREALVRGYPDELYVEWRAGQPVYYGLRVGDRLKDADSDVESPRIAEWTVTEITPERVVGKNLKTGDEREFERETVERGLVIGNYGTNLSAFALVTVHAVGSWEAFDPDAEGPVYRGKPYLTVVAYGNNGEKYGLRYRYVEDGNDEVASLWEEDVAVSALGDTLREALFEVVETALDAEGYVVSDDE